MEKPIYSLLEDIGLHEYFPKRLCIRDAVQIREDTLNTECLPKDSMMYPFVILQRIMAFDLNCRISLNKVCSNTDTTPNGSSDSESEESENGDSIHPMDGLLALIHCCDNFLRQDLFSRMATCQIALPFILPDPLTGELTMLLWAIRSIVKEFEMPDKKAYCDRVIRIPMHFVSFLRVGCHSISKSEIMNDIMTKRESGNRNEPFFGYNSPGGGSKKVLVNGLVEISWYLPGNGLYPLPIAFINLRGDASDPKFEKQLDFLCKISAINVLLFSSDILEDGTRKGATALLKKLSTAQGMTILLQTKKETKEFKKTVSVTIGESRFQSKFNILKHERNRTNFIEKLKDMLIISLEKDSRRVSLSDIASESGMACDENDLKCKRGKQLMEELFSVMKGYVSSSKRSSGSMLSDKSPKDLLPLQSEGLWHAWAAHDKEQYRQKHRHKHGKIMTSHSEQKSTHELSAEEYGEEQRKNMSMIRDKQYAIVKKKESLVTKFMPLFISAIRSSDKIVLCYFMQWLKIALDDLSREILPPFYASLSDLRAKLNEAQRNGDEHAEKNFLQELKALDKKMINASFGVEHLMREVGQMYEAVAECEDVTPSECSVSDLPQIAAQMLYDGFTLELLDGHASHMPQKWISAVLHNLARLLKGDSESDPRIYVLSVLGIQSTGKSTLLNTVFGVQFSVSAGRCTRGAFMQLIPVHVSLHKKIGVKYFLLIDTEGLRAPELERLAAFEHDNELATFVIGVANQTLINVSGEVAGEIDDVLNAAVHAFMRMSEVHLKPSCHIIHQNVPAVTAKDKLEQGRLKTNNKLDRMTKAAAKDTDRENKYKFFSDVIQFDYKEDVSEFVALWNGELPMAQVSSGYSIRAQRLKVGIINKCGKYRSRNTVPLLLGHLDKLWNAILQEDFVFTFQNTYEIVAYKALEVKFSDCTGRFMTDINGLQQAAENELYSCNAIELDKVLEKHTELLKKGAWERFKKCEEQMMDFIKEDDIMLKWKQDMELRLKHLYEETMANVKENNKQAYQAKKDRNGAESEREALGNKIQKKVVELTKEIGEKIYSKSKLIDIFNQTWSEWIANMKVNPFKMPNIENAIEKCITDFFPGKWKDIRAKIMDKGLQKCTEFEVTINHIKSKTTTFQKVLALFLQNPQINPLQKGQSYTEETFVEVDKYLKGIRASDRNFSPQCVTQLLQIVKRRRSTNFKDFEFTEIYEVEVAITACSKAKPVFKEMAEKFRMEHDPLVFIENKMKPNFRHMFIQMVNKVEYEKTAAEALCTQLKDPINKCILQVLPSLIFKEITSNCMWTKHKQTFIAKILLEMGEKLNKGDGFDLCIHFLTNTKSSLEYWARCFINQHFTSAHITEMAKSVLNETVDFLIKKVENSSQTPLQKRKVNIREWVRHFHSQVTGKLKISLIDLNLYVQDHELLLLEFFTNTIKEGLQNFKSVLCQSVTYPETTSGGVSAHEMVLNKVAGCIEQCPFCGAQCELTNSDHIPGVPHSTQHRPQALGGYRWVKTDKATLDICTALVSTTCNFRNADTEGKYHPCNKYRELYPNWLIQADKSFQASLFWKWFIGHYSRRIEGHFKFSETNIPKEWKQLQWTKVREWLITEYKLQ